MGFKFIIMEYLTIYPLDISHVMWWEYIQKWWSSSHSGVEMDLSHSGWVWVLIYQMW